ncbi:uncharacterized protein [Rutidosis leptorrhynchoides]|uniref:uncharacterized protein n=1 Tax=Rutidosis leptorrhynchoides TaxID=125765 RepID=UPI003A99A260
MEVIATFSYSRDQDLFKFGRLLSHQMFVSLQLTEVTKMMITPPTMITMSDYSYSFNKLAGDSSELWSTLPLLQALLPVLLG